MSHLSIPSLSADARESLRRAEGHRRLVLLNAGVSALLALLASGCNLLLEQGIDTTGGLAGMGLRSALSTVQALLTMVMTLALPFWNLGYTSATLNIARGQRATPATLLDGFRRFFPALRLFLLTYLLYTLIGIGSLYLGSMALTFTPLSDPVYTLILPLLESGADPTSVDPLALLQAMAPMFIGCAALCIAICIPVSYRLRMAQLCLLDAPAAGALRAMLTSSRMMKGRCVSLFRLDLRFWWFYLAEGLLAVVSYGDVLLPALGVNLPMDATTAYFAFYILSLALQLGLYLQVKNRVSTTYAHAYLSLLSSQET